MWAEPAGPGSVGAVGVAGSAMQQGDGCPVPLSTGAAPSPWGSMLRGGRRPEPTSERCSGDCVGSSGSAGRWPKALRSAGQKQRANYSSLWHSAARGGDSESASVGGGVHELLTLSTLFHL